MHDPKVLANVFKRNKIVIDRQVEGLSHDDSLLQPEARGNCLNYVLGHMMSSRETVMKMLDLEPLMTADEKTRYGSDAEPIAEDGKHVLRLERLMELLAESNEMIVGKILQLSTEELEQDVQLGESAATLGQRLEFFGWHEAYHVGQTEYLRQLAGTDDKVI